ncbi:MAG: flavin reductase family protein [bacterium]
MAVSSETYRQVLGRFATGVTIITVKNEDGMHGLTVNAFTSLSLDPPLVLICIQKNGVSHGYFSGTRSFVVNILNEKQEELANRFADTQLNSQQRFQQLSFQFTRDGIPILRGTLGHLECRLVNQYDGGDHSIFIGQVENAEVAETGKPLLFYESQYVHL